MGVGCLLKLDEWGKIDIDRERGQRMRGRLTCAAMYVFDDCARGSMSTDNGSEKFNSHS